MCILKLTKISYLTSNISVFYFQDSLKINEQGMFKPSFFFLNVFEFLIKNLHLTMTMDVRKF